MSTPLSLVMSEAARERLLLVLNEDFSYGFRVGSMIDGCRFKTCYAKRYDSELEHSEKEITKLLLEVGILRGNRIFSKESAKAETEITIKILTDIAGAFKAGAKCVYFSELFSKYHDYLTSKLKIFELDVFRKVLADKLGGMYRFNKDCVYKDAASEFGTFEEVDNFIRSSSEPVTSEAIHKKLWYVPLEVISKYLQSSRPKEFVKTEEGTYFYALNFPVMPEELEQIHEAISDQLYVKDFLTADELRELISRDLPGIFMSLENFTTHEIFTCLSVLLKDKFSFNGSLISNISQPVNADDVFREFCAAHDEVTVDDIKNFASDIGRKSRVRWKTISDVMSRVSENKFINSRNLHFNIQEVDRAIDEILGGSDYRPLKNMNLFINYPQCGHSWNKYLLESYAAKFSWEFTLLYSSPTTRNGPCAIVRKNSGIKNFQMLITRVLANSNSRLTRDEALAFLVREGYLNSRNYPGIDKAILDAGFT